MKEPKLTFEEEKLANILRNEVLQNSQNIVKPSPQKTDLAGLEYISTNKKEPASPLMTMNEDEILAFVEEFEPNELATLSVAELKRIEDVLGLDFKIFVEGVDY